MSDLYSFNRPISEEELIETAKRALAEKLVNAPVFSSPQVVRDFLILEMANLEVEVFYVLYLDAQHKLLEQNPLCSGTVSGAAVYPREVVRHVIKSNAVAVILAHNHPSGVCEPSAADRRITERIKNALALIDVNVLDHLVVGGDTIYSFAERGEL